MAKVNLQSVIWKEGKNNVAQSLNIDVSSFGKTKKQALKNLNEALELYFEDEKPKRLVKIGEVEIVSSRLEYA